MSGAKPAIVVTLAGVLLAICLLFPFGPSTEEQERELKRHFSRGQYEEAVELGNSLLGESRLSAAFALKAGESAAKLSRYDEAMRFYQSVSADVEQYVTAQFALGEVLRQQGAILRAESAYKRVLSLDSDHPLAHSRLAFLQMITGRPAVAIGHLRRLLELQTITVAELCWLADPERGVDAVEYLTQARAMDSSDPLPLMGLADAAFRQGHFEEARQYLAETTAAPFPDWRILQLRVALEYGEVPTVPDDVQPLLDACVTAKRYDGLYVLGATFEGHQQTQNAIRCYALCLQCHDHAAAMQHLASLLAADADSGNGLATLRQRASMMSELTALTEQFQTQRATTDTAREIADLMRQLGRKQEADAWAAAAGADQATVSSESPASADITALLRSCVERYPELHATEAGFLPDSAVQLTSSARLVDEAAEVGLDFTYFESPDPATPGRRMFEFTGGGVAVVDIDNDTWPDLHLTQGTDWPVQQDSERHLDAIYRNLRGQRFTDITADCGIAENQFSQGISCGDLNNDGFTDICVANIGENSIWINLGDGTFYRRPVETGEPSVSQWTSSIAVADVNLDGFADVFEVNYIGGAGFDSVICETPAGPRVCAPNVFEPTTDRLLLNDGAGQLDDVSQAVGIHVPGNGLGIVVTNLDADPMPEIFVANDAMPNVIWDNQASPGSTPQYEEVATLRGAAAGAEGQSQACMGVAADDFDGDGTTDLFVTNYYNESNAIYFFDESGIARDAARQSGVQKLSSEMLGFGTQVFDANADGWPDLFVVNGDLDDFSHEGRQFDMAPQLMLNDGTGAFREQEHLHAEDIRNERFRGRGVARCDWNHDRQWELVVSCLDRPAMLIHDAELQASRQTVAVRFVGRDCSRTGFGLLIGRQTAIPSGCGYMASNEPLVLATNRSPLQILWPSAGTAMEIQLTDHPRQVIVEGRSRSWFLPH